MVVVAAGAAGWPAAGAAVVVVVTGGGGLGFPEASGGGLVGVWRLSPKTGVSICCAAGWSTTSTTSRC